MGGGALRAIDAPPGTKVIVYRQGREKKTPFEARIGDRIETHQDGNSLIALVGVRGSLPINKIGAGTTVVIRRNQ